MKSWLKQNLPAWFDRDNNVQTLTLPIFPLKTVLFPGGLLPLKVFETRYVDMLKQCVKDNTGFGVCLIREGEEVGAPALPEEVGTLAAIRDWDMPQLGLWHINAAGGRRFVIESHSIGPQGLVLANVVLLSEENSQPVPPDLQQCSQVLQAIRDKVGSDWLDEPQTTDDAVWLSYRLAEILPLKLSVKQNLLEMNDPITRLQILYSFLQKQGLAD